MGQGKTVLFISRNDLIKRAVIGGNIDPEAIVPHMYTAQNKYILPLLGSVLYYKIQDDIQSGTITGVYKDLVDNLITDTLVHYTMVESLPFLAYRVTNAGIQKHVSEQGESVSKNEVDFLLTKSLQSAQFFAERLVEYLMAHNVDFPEYNQSTGYSDTVWPNKKSQFSTGWIL